MMDLYTLDFESYFDSKDYSLKKLTTQQYIDDPRFEVIGVAVKKNEEETQWFSGTHEETKEWLGKFNLNQGAVVMHHAHFDATILSYRFGIFPKLVLCTLSMARAVHGTEVGGSLAALAERYGIGEKGNEIVNAMGKRRKDFAKEDLARYGAYCVQDVELTHQLFKRLAPHFNKTEIALIDMTVRMFSEPRLELDRAVLEQHLEEVRNKKENLLDECGIDKADLMSNPKLAEVLRSFGVEPPMKVSARTGKEALAFAKSDEGFKALLEHDDLRIQAIVAARLGVKSTLEETRTERFIEIQETNGMLPVPLKYYGAITGRWAASDKINLQNLPRASQLKKAIRAPLGHVIVGADLSAIELRMGLAFAGQEDKLDLLRNGLDLYRDFIAPIYNVPYDQVSDGQRFIGKTSQLSLVYGTGHKKLRAAIKADARFGTDIGEALAQELVNKYRNEYSSVKSAWYNAGKALRGIWMDDAEAIGIGPLELPVVGSRGIRLPNGLYMTYSDLRQTIDDDGREQWVYKTRKGPTHIHPAKCFQNVTQALARCVIGEAMVRVNKRYPVAHTIHDALYCVVPANEAEDALKFIITELRQPPKWMPNLPLDAEGGWGEDLAFKMGKIK